MSCEKNGDKTLCKGINPIPIPTLENNNGATTTWVCPGINGGDQSNTCKATRSIPTTPTGTIYVTITPAGLSGAGWRLDGGEWQNSGNTLTNIPVGEHTIDFNNVEKYTTPTQETIILTEGQTISLNGNYTYACTIENHCEKISSCQYLTYPGTYVLQNNVSGGSPCFRILSEGITIDGNGHKVDGSIDGTPLIELSDTEGECKTNPNINNKIDCENNGFVWLAAGNPGYSVNLINIIVTGYIITNGRGSTNFTGGRGGNGGDYYYCNNKPIEPIISLMNAPGTGIENGSPGAIIQECP